MGNLIRTQNPHAGRAFSFQDLESRAAGIVARARARGARILKEAERRAQQLVEQQMADGYRRGVEQGRVAGLEQIRTEARAAAFDEARKRASALIDALAAGLSEFEHNKRRLLASAESGLIELALSVARRVCKIAVGRSSEPAQANARHLLGMVGHDSDLTLHVSPAEYDALLSFASAFVQHANGLEHVEVVADPAVAPGDCVLHAADGTLDASIEQQLDRLAEQICADAAAPTVEREGS